MAVLPSSGALSINDIKNVMGGPASPAMSNYYRGGAYVPSTKTITTREPTSGANYSESAPVYYWVRQLSGPTFSNKFSVWWNGSRVVESTPTGTTSYTTGSTTYYRDAFQRQTVDPYTNDVDDWYKVYRQTTSTTNINTSVPTSGTISINQFYGAEKP